MNRRELLAGAAASAVAAACPALGGGEPVAALFRGEIGRYEGIRIVGLDPAGPCGDHSAAVWLSGDGDVMRFDGFCIDEAGPIPRKAWDEPMPHLLGDSVSPLPYHEDNIYDRLMTSTVGNPFRTF